MAMRRRLCKAVAAMGAVVLLTGCFGGGQAERILRVKPLNQCVEAPGPRPGARAVVIESVTSLPGLRRTAVLFEKDRVLQPSGLWHYEAEPEELVGQALVRGLVCSRDFELVWPYSSRARPGMLLTGQVSSFEVRRSGGNRFRAEVVLTQWAADTRRAVSSRTFTAEEDLRELSPEEIAVASERALGRIVKETLDWLREAGLSAKGE